MVRGFSEDLLAVGQMPAGSWPRTYLREELSREREQHAQESRGRNEFGVFQRQWGPCGWSRSGPASEEGWQGQRGQSWWDLQQRAGLGLPSERQGLEQESDAV